MQNVVVSRVAVSSSAWLGRIENEPISLAGRFSRHGDSRVVKRRHQPFTVLLDKIRANSIPYAEATLSHHRPTSRESLGSRELAPRQVSKIES